MRIYFFGYTVVSTLRYIISRWVYYSLELTSVYILLKTLLE